MRREKSLAEMMALGTPLKLDLGSKQVWISSDAERKLALVIAEVTEEEREAQRVKYGKGFTPLTDDFDVVDGMHWDELLLGPSVVMECSKRAGVSPVEVLNFAKSNCMTSNPSALFWMHAWFQYVYESHQKASQDVAEAIYATQMAFEQKMKEDARQKAKAAADARHGKPGGPREKREKIRAIWATGKYATRALCTTEEYEALGFGTYDTARKCLDNTPNPDPWPAKKGNTRAK